ncbi:hypothetical protein HID58_093971, partial [Brassica napus]
DHWWKKNPSKRPEHKLLQLGKSDPTSTKITRHTDGGGSIWKLLHTLSSHPNFPPNSIKKKRKKKEFKVEAFIRSESPIHVEVRDKTRLVPCLKKRHVVTRCELPLVFVPATDEYTCNK